MTGPRPSLLLVSSILVLVLVGGCASDEERFAEHLQRAERYEASGELKEALIELRRALQVQPQSAEVNQRIAQLMFDVRRFEDALFFYGEAYRLDSTNVEAAVQQARLLLGSEPDRAEELLGEVGQRFPEDSRVQTTLSELWLVRGDTQQALAAALVATELDPEASRAFGQLGRVHQARIREIRQVEGEEPEDAEFEKALAAMRRADELAGGSVPARIQIGRTYVAWGDHQDEAATAFRSAVELGIEQQEWQLLADATSAVIGFARRNDPELLRWVLEKGVETGRMPPEAWRELALLERRDGREAEPVMQRMLEALPEDPTAHIQYASFLVAEERPDEALAHLRGKADEEIEPAVLLAEAVRIEWRLGRREAAAAALADLRAKHPESPHTKRVGARIALAEGRNVEAAGLLRELVGGAAEEETYRLLAVVEFRLRNFADAATAIERANELRPGGPRAAGLRLELQIHAAARDWPKVLGTIRALRRTGVRPTQTDRLLLSRASYELGREQVGRRVLMALLAEDPPPIGAAIQFARRHGADEPDAARAYLEDARARAPRNVGVLGALTRLDVSQGRGAEAVARLDRVLETGPAGPRLYYLRARALASLGDYERVEEDARLAFELAPTLMPALELLLASYQARGRLEEAVRSFAEAEAAGLLQSPARVLLARLYRARGDAAQAEALLEKVLAGSPDVPAAQNDLAYLIARRGGDLDRALDLAQSARQALGEDPNTADTLALVLHRRGRNEEALQQARLAIELSEARGQEPQPVFWLHQGLILRALERPEEAAVALEKALAGGDLPDADRVREELEAARAAARAQAARPS